MSRGPHITAEVRRVSEPEITDLVVRAQSIARRHGISVKSVLNLGVAAVSKARIGSEPLEFIPMGGVSHDIEEMR